MRVFVNGKFHSCEEENQTFSVLVEQRGKIVYTGDEVPARYARKRCIDLASQTVVPAFADTHLHFESYAVFLSTVDVRDATNFEEMGRMLRAYADIHPREKFLIAFGCCAHTVSEKRLPDRNDLDKMLPLPLLLVKYDGHAAVANSALIDQFPDSGRGIEYSISRSAYTRT